MENRIVTLHVFRYHLLPLSKDPELNLFEKSYTEEEIKENKNAFFAKVLEDLNYYNTKKFPLKIEHFEGNHYFIKFAQKKSTTIVKDFKKDNIETEPFVYIIINNEKNVQKIAISDNPDAFSSPSVVRNILKDILKKGLEEYSLNIEIEELFESEEFWSYIDSHRFALKKIKFKFIKPNLASISNSLPEIFKNFCEDTNSHKSEIMIEAPEKGILENIERSNNNVTGLVDYASNGGGDVKVTIKGIRKSYSPKSHPVTLEIDELSLEGTADQVIKIYPQILKE